eukprot:2986527-Heterocapsa_arctica.AAC.1
MEEAIMATRQQLRALEASIAMRDAQNVGGPTASYTMDDSFNEGLGRLLRDVLTVNTDDIDGGKGGSSQGPDDVRSPRA